MAFSTQANFVGKLDGTDVNELNKQIDYKKTKLDDRMKVVEKLINGTEFYGEYFDNYFKANINAGDYLSNDVNVCKSLERMANYILNSEEIKAEEDASKTQYVFHTDAKYFQKKVDREGSIEKITQTENGGHEESIIHFLKREDGNSKKEKAQYISMDDLQRDDFLGEVLRSYYPFYEYLTNELKNKNSAHNRYLLTKAKGQVDLDMKYSKDHLLGVFGYDLKTFSETTEPDLDIFDFTNPVHLKGRKITFVGRNRKGQEVEHEVLAKGLLYFKPDFDPTNDFSIILTDLEETVNKAGLTSEERFILNGLRDGLTQLEIAEQLHTNHVKIGRTMDIITNKVIAVGNKYDGKREEAI